MVSRKETLTLFLCTEPTSLTAYGVTTVGERGRGPKIFGVRSIAASTAFSTAGGLENAADANERNSPRKNKFKKC